MKTVKGRDGMKKFLSVILALAAVLTLSACSKTADGGDKNNSSSYKPDDIALKSENFTITRAEVSYIFYQNYNEFVNTQPDSVDMYNIDTNSSLKGQEYHDGISWFRYFADATLDYMKYVLVFCEAARADGLELDEEDKASVDEAVQSYYDYAEKYDYDVQELFTKTFNSDVTPQVLRAYLEKDALAHKYYYKLIDSYEHTDDELSAFVEENPYKFYSIDYISYTFDEDFDSNAKESAAALASISDTEEFKKHIEDYASDIKTDTVLNIEDCIVRYAARNEYSEFSVWAFDGAEAGETYTAANELEGTYTVYLLTSAPSLQEYKTRDFRFIKEYVSGHDSFQETMNFVNGLLEEWKTGEASEESFAALADEHNKLTDDELGGGLYLNAAKSDTALPQTAIDWLFAEDTEPGDTTVVKGDACYMALYYIGEDEVQWKFLAKQGLSEKKYLEDYEKYSEKYPVTVDNDVVDSLEA